MIEPAIGLIIALMLGAYLRPALPDLPAGCHGPDIER